MNKETVRASDSEIEEYLNMLSGKIVSMYGISRTLSDKMVDQSPMRKLLQSDSEAVFHSSLRVWAELVYGTYSLLYPWRNLGAYSLLHPWRNL